MLDGVGAVVWRVPLTETSAPRRDEALTRAERAQRDRYLDPARADVFARTRAAARAILAPLCGLEPHALRIERDPGGKPRLCAAGAPSWNASHSGRWALIAVGREPVGVDLEYARARPPEELRPIARRVFHEEEMRACDEAPAAARAAMFYRLWVRKESYMKWDGRGFTLGPSSLLIGWSRSESPLILDLDVDEDHPAELCLEPSRAREDVRLLTLA